ncbi:MAG: death-on-curing protein [Alphaproteobacteria bacterium 41-28]|nr:MAG: death-on-curing protein [Alphaproteobacteria bacterium 41-28]
MKEPIWILNSIVLAIHNEQLSEHKGQSGIRDIKLLESAFARPQNLYAYQSPTLFELAASYAYGIIKNHPFIDGNKRSSFVVSLLFLELNGYELIASREEKVTTFLKLASGSFTERELSNWYQKDCSPIKIKH